MRYFCELIFLLLPWLTYTIEGPPYFRPNSYSTIVGPGDYYRHEQGFAPVNYRRDLTTEESKRKEGPKRYSPKKIPYRQFSSEEDDLSAERYTSGEFSSESNSAFNSNENDSREYTIGTQIRVQHPITVPKKSQKTHIKHPKSSSSNGSYKSAVYSDYVPLKEPRFESHPSPSKQHGSRYTHLYDSTDPIHIVPPPQTAGSSFSYEPEPDDYQPHRKTKSGAYERYKAVASKKQIEQYLEDQQKMLDEALKIQLLNDPKFQQYVHAKEKERLEKEHYDSEELTVPNPPPEFHPHFNENFNGHNGRRRPKSVDLKRPINGKPPLIQNNGKHLPRRFRSAIVINV